MNSIANKFLLLVTATLLSAPAFALPTKHSVSGMLGAFNGSLSFVGDRDFDGATQEDRAGAVALSGLFLLGGEYTYRMSKTMGISALAKYQSSCDDVSSGPDNESCLGMLSVGGLWRHFLRAGGTEFSVGGGLVNVIPTLTQETSTNNVEWDLPSFFGALFSLSASYTLSDNMALGFDYQTTWAMSDAMQGTVSDFIIKLTLGL